MKLNQGRRSSAIAFLFFAFIGYNFIGCKKDETLELSPKADFFFIVTNPGTLPAVVNFSSVSSRADTFKWEFDNGITSDLENPTTRYTENKVFKIKLVVSNAIGSDSITRQVQINKGQRPVRDVVFPKVEKDPI